MSLQLVELGEEGLATVQETIAGKAEFHVFLQLAFAARHKGGKTLGMRARRTEVTASGRAWHGGVHGGRIEHGIGGHAGAGPSGSGDAGKMHANIRLQ